MLQHQYDEALDKLSSLNIHPETILDSLGLAHFALDTPIAHLSGGQKTRLMLARVRLEKPHLLRLDEPTNHLDIEMLEWLEDWLNHFQGAVLIVPHDRVFLDNTVTSILESDLTTHTLKAYAGKYNAFIEQKSSERKKQIQAYPDQQDQIAQLRVAAGQVRALTQRRKGGKADNGDKFAKGFFGTAPPKM